LGSFQYGYAIACINTVLAPIAAGVSCTSESLINGSIIIGGSIGALVAGVLADRFGPKTAQILSCWAYGIGAVCSGAATGVHLFIAGRILAGLGAGASSLLVPRYIAEVSPTPLRGSLVTLHQVFINIGILVAYSAGIPYDYGVDDVAVLGTTVPWWRVVLCAGALPAMLQLLCLLACRESPVWLESHDKEAADEACIALWGTHAILYEATSHEDEEGAVEQDVLLLGGLGQLKQPLLDGYAHVSATTTSSGAPVVTNGNHFARASATSGSAASNQVPLPSLPGSRHPEAEKGWLGGVFRHEYRSMLVLALGLPLLQQACGINAMILFSSEVFQDAGMSSPIWASILMGAVNVGVSLGAGGALDRVGRRPLMLASYVGMAVCLFTVAVINTVGVAGPSTPAGGDGTPTPAPSPSPSPGGGDGASGDSDDDDGDGVFTAALMLAYVAFYALGAGPITWLYLSEILPIRIKGTVAGLATFLGWGGNLLVAFSFVPLLSSLGFGATFTIYAALSVLGALFVFWRMVETKQKSLRQIESMLLLPPRVTMQSVMAKVNSLSSTRHSRNNSQQLTSPAAGQPPLQQPLLLGQPGLLSQQPTPLHSPQQTRRQ